MFANPSSPDYSRGVSDTPSLPLQTDGSQQQGQQRLRVVESGQQFPQGTGPLHGNRNLNDFSITVHSSDPHMTAPPVTNPHHPNTFDEKRLRSLIRARENWPKPGVIFRDISPLLQDPQGMRMVHQTLADRYRNRGITHIGVLEARGFLFGPTLADTLGLPLVIFRKPGKLPSETICEEYALEYGSAAMEVHIDALEKDSRVVLIDDLIATGGTMLAASTLVSRLGGTTVEAAAIINLPDLGGSTKLQSNNIRWFSLTSY